MNNIQSYEKPASESVIAREKMPPEVWFKIFSLLAVKDLVSCMQVCSQWNQWANDDILWKALFQKDICQQDVLSDYKSWKFAYYAIL